MRNRRTPQHGPKARNWKGAADYALEQQNSDTNASLEILRTSASAVQPVVPVRSGFFNLVLPSTAAGSNAIIPFRAASSLIFPQPDVVQPQRGELPAFSQPYAVPAMRMGQLLSGEPVKFVQPQYVEFPFSQTVAAPSNNFISFSTRILSELQERKATAYSSFTGFSYTDAATPAPSNPVIDIRIGQWINDPGPRFALGPGFIPFAYFASVSTAAANPIIPINVRELSGPREQRTTAFSAFTGFSYTDATTPATANPVIPIQTRRLSELSVPQLPPQSSYQTYLYNPFAAPVIPFCIGQLPADKTPPAFVAPRFFQFPYWQGTVAPASPVIGFRKGQWIGDQVEPLKGIQGYQEFPWNTTAIAPTSPVIPISTRILSELQVPQTLPRSGFYAWVNFSTITVSQLIGWRTGQWLGGQVPQRIGIQGYQSFPYWIAPLPANPVIQYRTGQWLGGKVQPLWGIHGFMAFPWTNNEISLTNPILIMPADVQVKMFETRERVRVFESRSRGSYSQN